MARTKPHGHRSLDQGLGLGNRKTTSLKKSRDRIPKVPSPIASAPVASHTRRRRRAGADPWIPKRKPNKSNPRPRSPPATHFTCRICAEEKPVDEFIKWVGPRKRYSAAIGIPFGCVSHLCRNPRSKNDPVCKECIGQFLSARLDTVGARQVGTGCLEPGCQNPWDSAFVLRYLPSGSQLEKYNNGMLTVWMENLNPKLFHCISEDCSSVGMLDLNAPGYPQVTCNGCSTRMCAVCNVAWHPRVTCAEHAAKTINIQMSDPEKDVLQLMQTKDGRRCPNCQLVIEKDGGCDSMYCAGCRTYFDWQTAASAVLGTRTPLQAVPGRPYWLVQPKNRVCETDVILKAERAKARAEMRAERKRKRGEDENTPLRRSARCAALNNRVDAST